MQGCPFWAAFAFPSDGYEKKEVYNAMLTIRQIAQLAGVSRGTVDRVLNNRAGVNPETAARVRRIAEEVGYQPNIAGQLLAARKRDLRIAFVCCDTPDTVYFQDVLRAAREKAASLEPFGITVKFYLFQEMAEEAMSRVLRQLEEDRPDGVALLPIALPSVQAFIARMEARGTPMVFYNADYHAKRLCYVGSDYIQAGRVAAGLVALCTDRKGTALMLSHHDLDSPPYLARSRGFRQELARYPELRLFQEEAIVFQNEDCAQAVETVRRHPEINAVYIVNLGDFSICRSVYEGAGRPISIITNDLVPAQREMLREGIISATMTQQPEVQGAMPIQILSDYLLFDEVPQKDRFYTDLSIRIAQNM